MLTESFKYFDNRFVHLDQEIKSVFQHPENPSHRRYPFLFFPFFPMVSTPQVWHQNATDLSGKEIWFSSLTVWITSVCYFNLVLVLPITYRNRIFLPKGAEIFPNPFPHCAYNPKEKSKTGFVARFGGRERVASLSFSVLASVARGCFSFICTLNNPHKTPSVLNSKPYGSKLIFFYSTINFGSPQRDHSAPAGEFALPHARWTAENNSNWARRM